MVGIALTSGAAYLFWVRPAAPVVGFTTLHGEKLTLEELRGKVVYVNFWATSCGYLREGNARYRRDL